jgi:hypothetical protein
MEVFVDMSRSVSERLIIPLSPHFPTLPHIALRNPDRRYPLLTSAVAVFPGLDPSPVRRKGLDDDGQDNSLYIEALVQNHLPGSSSVVSNWENLVRR